jgi:hypothetical protein
MKNIILSLMLVTILSSFALADTIDIVFFDQTDSTPEFAPGEPITFRVNIYDSQNKLINTELVVEIKDSEKKTIEQTIQSGQLVNIDLGEKASSGQGIITAKYQGLEAIAFFNIGRKELANFELEGDTLKITNIGNTPYSKIIKITIGETTRTKEISLEIDQSLTYKLVAPGGNYIVKVTDGQTTLTRSDVTLTGTGQAIGAIDNSASSRSPVTGGISPNQGADEALLGYIKSNTFVYVFIFVIFGAMILIAIERRYKKKARK